MSNPTPRLLVTGASGQLGRLVIEHLLRLLPASQLVAGVRTPASVADLTERGVEVRVLDYDRPETLDAALQGIDRVLLISSSEIGRRAPQHRAVIQAAQRAGVGLLVYTSLLHADRSPLALRTEHLATEADLAASGLPHVILRNGWYTENHLGFVQPTLAHGALSGAAGQGRIASAARNDYAEAAARVLAQPEAHLGQTLELAGDTAWTLDEWTAELASLTGKALAYHDLPEAEFRQLLVQVGLPEPLADLLADSDAGAAKGGLFDGSGTLGRLLGRPTTPLRASMAEALAH